MDKKAFLLKAEALVAVVTLIIIAVSGIVGGKIIEANAFEEVAKWVLMGIGITVGVCLLAWWPLRVIYDSIERKKREKK